MDEKDRELAHYLEELEAEVGPPGPEAEAEAQAIIDSAVTYNPVIHPQAGRVEVACEREEPSA